MPIELIKKTGRVDLTAYLPKSPLPTGIEMGEFVVSAKDPFGGFTITHNLGTIPNVILIYREDINNTFTANIIRAAIKINVGKTWYEDYGAYTPDDELIRCFYDNSSSLAQFAGSTPDVDTDTYFYVPSSGSSRIYHPGEVYKWIAIAYGGNE